MRTIPPPSRRVTARWRPLPGAGACVSDFSSPAGPAAPCVVLLPCWEQGHAAACPASRAGFSVQRSGIPSLGYWESTCNYLCYCNTGPFPDRCSGVTNPYTLPVSPQINTHIGVPQGLWKAKCTVGESCGCSHHHLPLPTGFWLPGGGKGGAEGLHLPFGEVSG